MTLSGSKKSAVSSIHVLAAIILNHKTCTYPALVSGSGKKRRTFDVVHNRVNSICDRVEGTSRAAHCVAERLDAGIHCLRA